MKVALGCLLAQARCNEPIAHFCNCDRSSTMADVTIYEDTNFTGRSMTLGIGERRLFDANDMNDMTSSIQVPPGLVAYVYEHADSKGGYGIAADLMEDCADLSQFDFNDKISYITVFAAETPEGHIWARARVEGGQFIPGHWERKRANGQLPPNNGVAVSPPLPPHDLVQPVVTGGGTIAEPDSAQVKNEGIQSFTEFDAQSEWDYAVSKMMGILGSSYRGVEEIGSAAFERASNNIAIPDWINFWYPQKQPNDHRSIVYFKRTLSGKLVHSHVANISGTYQDHDLNIDIEPNEEYRYLITDGHERSYTDIMSTQWNLTAHQSGQASCDDAESVESFNYVEAELQNDPNTMGRLNTMLNGALGRQVSVYGPWIYDKGHCCHPEIHPAEQVWWGDPTPTGATYFCHVFVDESKRFWWRNQMDDGTKLKPWGAPPITGTFAIAFEAQVNAPAKQFTIAAQDAYNHVTEAEGFDRHNLVYQNNTLVSVIQDPNNRVKVSFEKVGLVGANTVRGFVVIEATVGRVIQKDNPIIVPGPQPIPINLPPNSDPNQVPENVERLAFTKEGGRLVMVINEGPSINTLVDLNGTWASGGAPGPVISTTLAAITIDMSAYNRPPAQGTILDNSTISVNFPDDQTYSARLVAPNTIQWSTGS